MSQNFSQPHLDTALHTSQATKQTDPWTLSVLVVLVVVKVAGRFSQPLAPDGSRLCPESFCCCCFVVFIFMNGFGLKKKKNSDQIIILLPFIKTERKSAGSRKALRTTNGRPLILLAASLSSELSVETGKQGSYGSWQQTHLATACVFKKTGDNSAY